MSIRPLLPLLLCACGDRDLTATTADVEDVADDVSELEAAHANTSAAVDDEMAQLLDRLATTEADIANLRADVGELDDARADLETQFAEASESLDTAHDNIAGLGLQAEILADDLDTVGARGSTWSDTGDTEGVCASITLTTTIARPLLVVATVDTTRLISSGACYSSTSGCYSHPDATDEAVTVADLSVTGADGDDPYSETVTHTETLETEADVTAFTQLTDYTVGHDRTTQDTTSTPLVHLFEPGAAGTFEVNLEVASDGDVERCNLVVVQP